MVMAVQRGRPYLLGQQFVIKTNQKALKFLLEQRVGTEAQQKWIIKLLDFNFTVEYKKGKENSASNALSRSCVQTLKEEAVLAMVTFPTPLWLEELKSSYLSNLELKDLLNKLEKNEEVPTRYELLNGLILKKGRIVIAAASAFKTMLLYYTYILILNWATQDFLKHIRD